MKKWQIIVTICLLVINAILLIYLRNWAALLWELGCAFFLYQTFREMHRAYRCHKLNIELNEFIHNLTQHDSYKQLIKAEKIAECCRVNCERALKRMMMLKNLNKSLFRKIEELTKINLKQAETIKNLRRKRDVEE